MHRGTTIEDAGYKTGTSWPIVPDIKSAQDGAKYIKYVGLATIPAMALAYAVLFFSGNPVYVAAIGAAVVAVVAGVILFKLKKTVKGLIVNCKMVKVIADLAGAEVEHTAEVVFEAVTRKGDTERLAPINDKFGVYVNSGYKMDDGRVENPYIIFIKKVEDGAAEEFAA